MNKIRLAFVLATVAAAIAGFAVIQLTPSNAPVMRTSGEALIGGSFKLTGHKGVEITDQNFSGKYMLIFFGYTFCPDVCPAGLQVMTSALEQLGDDADNIQPLFITIDPQRDTVQVLSDYVSHFHPRLIGLTGTPERIAEAAKSYRVYYAKAGDEDGEDYLMDHSSILYLMGPNGQFLKHFTYSTDANALAEGLRAAIAAQQ